MSAYNDSPRPFAEAALSMRRAGFAVMPASGKTPRMAGFNKWKHAPGPAAVEKWAARNPDADIVYVPGLSRTQRGSGGIIVLDGDDNEACDRIVETFGDTPGKVRTRRGRHYLYRDPGGSLGTLSSLKRFGLNADIKHGRSIVVAPPSRHEKDREFSYAWDGCDETVIGDLPTFKTRALQELIDHAAPSPTRDLEVPVETPSPTRESRNYVTKNCPPAGRPRTGIEKLVARFGGRGLALNAWLCGQVGACGSLDALLDCARAFDAELIAAGLGSLDPDNELARRAAVVWKDCQARKLEPWVGARAVARSDAEEVKDLCAHKGGGDAFALLMLLRSVHGARMQRGETFALRTEAMEKCETLKWTAERFAKSRDVLLAAGYIRKVEAAKNTRNGRVEAQYVLVPRTLSVFHEAPDADPSANPTQCGAAQPRNLGVGSGWDADVD